jgi:hypothetical protein
MSLVAQRAHKAQQPDRSVKTVSGSFKVVGPRPVHGAQPGQTVELTLLEGELAHLVEVGHLAPAEPPEPEVSESSAPAVEETAEAGQAPEAIEEGA